MWKKDRININTVLENLQNKLNELENSSSNSINLLDTSDDIDEIKSLAQAITLEVVEFAHYWSKYCQTYNEAVSIDVENIQDKLNSTLQEIERLKGIIINKDEEIHRLYKMIAESPSAEIIARCNELLNEVEVNTKVIALQRKLKDKTDRHGDRAPMWRHDVNSDELAMDYELAGYKITQEMIKKFNMTQPSIRKRLIELGVYVGRKDK